MFKVDHENQVLIGSLLKISIRKIFATHHEGGPRPSEGYIPYTGSDEDSEVEVAEVNFRN